MMFLRNRYRAQAPPSFVKFASRAALEMIGWSLSTPRTDQVPLESYTARSSRAGTAR